MSERQITRASSMQAACDTDLLSEIKTWGVRQSQRCPSALPADERNGIHSSLKSTILSLNQQSRFGPLDQFLLLADLRAADTNTRESLAD